MTLCGINCGKKKQVEKERRLRANDREFNLKFKYATNAIKTSKYNIFTFLPLNLFEQFQRVANAYFVFLLVLQLIPQVSSLSWFTTVVPLVLVLAVSAIKDATDDYYRHKSDNQVNNRTVQVLSKGGFTNEKWMKVQVGDIIKLENNNFVTADLMLLSSSEPNSLVYIETAELDGETNLKVKQSLTITGDLGENLTELSQFDGEIVCEAPNNKLDTFTGTLTYKGEKYALDNGKILLRGCTLRNTEWCFGMVIFAGPDTKLMQNSGRTTLKRTSIDRLMNILVLWIFGFLGFMCIILAIGNAIWESKQGYYFQLYLPWPEGVNNAAFSGFLMFWSYVIILNTVVPISLYVSVEIIRLGNSFYINWDRKMYYPKKDTPSEARTTTLNEELGQIKYIFSDKTGTLTQNIMTFNKCTINGNSYGDVFDYAGNRLEVNEYTEKVDFSYNPLADPKFFFHDHRLVESVKMEDPATHEFFRLLALCHTAMSEEKKEGQLVYQAQSPDEGALVTAARNFGFVFRSRTPETITVVEMGKTKVYDLLAILDFNNERKRMSVIVQSPEGRLTLYCKGADTIVYELLDHSSEDLKEVTTDHLNEFAGEGLRTLVLAYKDLDKTYFADWKKRHHEASTSLENREEKLAVLYEEIEKDLKLIGASAIEDKLQDGVPQTIETLTKANIKIWVLTGDKQETAENIGYSCNMLQDEMKEIFIIKGTSPAEVEEELRVARRKMNPDSFMDNYDVTVKINKCSKASHVIPDDELKGDDTYGIIINGHSLAYALEESMEVELLRTACMCQAVICCRVTPLQKAQVVQLVKKYKKAVTLAIGDGANDVSMIKTAHIGVGISGQEGMQAVLSSDFSFAQFRYLQRLLLVHGRWSYIRMCQFLRYFFYKNFTFTLVHFWYGFFCGFSAQTVYDQWFITMYNLVYTSLPVLGMSLFDQDVDDRWSMEYPQLYEPGQENRYFNKKEFMKCVIHGVYSSLVLFFVPYGALYDTVRDDGKAISDYQSFALMAQTCLLLVVSAQIALDTAYWTAVNQFFIWGSLAVFFAISFTMYSDGMYLIFTGSFPFIGTARNSLNQPSIWLAIFLVLVLCLLPVVAYRFLRSQLKPTFNDRIQAKIREAKKRPMPPPRKARIRRTSSRRSGYAFSHTQGYGDLITSGKTFRSKIPFHQTGKFSPNERSRNN
ncbi:phospholipid-transporting ATPase ID-like [Hyla sarda]|uniref:phospholipid-transporting ATPase ID-like n=1 Tax=Hyla sarda TaxID=327740 RepID=UPI0024C40855|nr:phospholipid-transporting ATPase ID-like [Hyla sarda]XP_056402765.1 phospholipid-transporting ATPase ID-like [Hyla sarda]XP_056402774.1 phospholipid-transporting ATPase ID-like [Hyla sarda]XP_056402778.1 phospholipid-transporting ATPase ID-like [Hyla sarda]XP_056402783.1 phospholipid-transporting ATPase ID-like [Hyla sarda]XP_056402790.1 phospholipid-transporting ATPase ID-like [Hyla sarda]XP_056402799.1 phospholipid-transporting ATPase ID-like [Hyla sarda]XP_056402807.1 phospholipid-tran